MRPRYIILLSVSLLLSLGLDAQSLSAVGEGYAATSVNTAVFRNSSLVSYGDKQYISYYDPEGYVMLGERQLGGERWTLKRTQYKGNVLDAHNVISIGVDGKGFLHLCFDHHGVPLRYCRGVAPGSLEVGPLEAMTGVDEADVTYPEFYNLPGGDLLFAYRSGASGRGNLVLKRYDIAKGLWRDLQSNLISGEGERNAYWQLFVDSLGTIHISWVWRETPQVETNHDLCYARSRDGGQTWERSDGSAYALPITVSTAETVWHIPQGSELINQTSMTSDSQGRPYIATYWRDSQSMAVPQYRVLWHDGEQWRMREVGRRTEGFTLSGSGTKMIPISRPRIVSDGKSAWYIFRDAERDSRATVSLCPDLASEPFSVYYETPFSVDAWEPSLDLQLWEQRKWLNIFVQTTHQGDGEKVSEGEQSSEVYVLEIK